MKLEDLAPWNWFKKEEEESGQIVPVQRDTSRLAHPASVLDLHREFDRLFQAMERGLGGSKWPSLFSDDDSLAKAEWFRPSLDVASDEKEYSIKVEVPGIDVNDVTIEVEGSTLKVKGEKRQEKEEKDKDFYRVERSYGAFQRILDIPEDGDTDNIASNYKDGVLKISIPRKALPKKDTKKIDIKSE